MPDEKKKPLTASELDKLLAESIQKPIEVRGDDIEEFCKKNGMMPTERPITVQDLFLFALNCEVEHIIKTAFERGISETPESGSSASA